MAREDWYYKTRGEMTYAGYEKETLFNDGESLFEGNLSQYPNAYDITVYRYYEEATEDQELQTRAIIQSLAGYKNINNSRKILARKSFGLRTGDVISFTHGIWLVSDWINRQRSTDDYSSLIFCNQIMSFNKETKADSGEVDDLGRPIYTITNKEYNLNCYYTTTLMSNDDGEVINLPDNRAKVYLQYNSALSIGEEVSIRNVNYRIYGIDESYVVAATEEEPTYGVMILTLEMPSSTT